VRLQGVGIPESDSQEANFPLDMKPEDELVSELSMPSKDLGPRIARLRKQRDLTQVEVARRAKIHPVTLADIERGAAQPTLTTLEKLAKALRVPVTELLE
jgi:DNA-binding XRE family transcriptional regulator